jgi:hypothetical protein
MLDYFIFFSKVLEYLNKTYNIAESVILKAMQISSWKMAVRPLGDDDYTKYSKFKINTAMQKFKHYATEKDYFDLIDLIVEDMLEKKYVLSEDRLKIKVELRKYVQAKH